MNWGSAFLKQSQYDLQTYDLFWNQVPPQIPQALHYLQMATEKLAKVNPDKTSWYQPPKKSHYVLVPFLKQLTQKQGSALRKKLNYNFSNDSAFEQFITSLIPLATKIQTLVPSDLASVNCEYPWQTPSGEVIAPHEYPYQEIVDDSKYKEFIGFIHHLSRVLK